jgi:pimeloyl-ACP methyl ester carboxylesterase
MRRHPDRVARALLAGVEPLDCTFDMPSHVLAAMQRMWREAEQDERLKPYLPPGGLNAAAQAVLERLERKPISVSLQKNTVTVGPEDFRKALILHSAAGPEFILSLYHAHYEEWARFVYQTRRSRVTELPVLGALIDTSLSTTPQRRRLLQNDAATSLLGQWNFDRYLATADIWPSPDVGDAFRTEAECRIPVVFVHGDWDTQTPMENTLQIAPYYRKGHVLLVECGGHGALNQLDQHLPDTADALFAFLKSGKMETLPKRVKIPAPRFGVPNFPVPQRSSAAD